MGQAKRNQQRHCPSLGKIITPATCASGRNSQIACTQDCPHNPFNPENYEGIYQKVEGEVVKKLSFELYQDPSFKFLQRIKKAVFGNDQFLANALHAWHIHGEDRCKKWLEQGTFEKWKNDEIIMARSLDTIRGAVVEIQGTLDDRRTLARDLLRPDEPPFVLIDMSTAAKSCRFDVFLTWIYEIPGGLFRLSGVAIKLTDCGTTPYSEALAILLRHLGAPDSAPEKWILEHIMLVSEAYHATQSARLARQYEISDIVFSVNHCQIGKKGSHPGTAIVKKLVDKLLSDPLVVDDGPGDPGPILRATLLTTSALDHDVNDSVGSINVFPDGKIELACNGRKQSARLLDFMKKMEPSLVVLDETTNDFSAEMLQEIPHWDPDLVPPALLESVSEISLLSKRIATGSGRDPMQAGLESSFKNFADISIPALDNRTPRDAASDPILRPRLIDQMKRQVNMVDHERSSKGVNFDINPLLEELGLHEIIHRPAPCGKRASLEEIDDHSGEFFEMPPHQLVIQGMELERRLEAATETDLAFLMEEGPIVELLSAVAEFSPDLSEFEIDALRFAIALVHEILHPHPPKDYDPDIHQMLIRFDHYWDQYNDLKKDSEIREFSNRLSADTQQPNVYLIGVTAVANRIGQDLANSNSHKKMAPLLIALSAAMCEITLWPPSDF
jgi:hypothetical protein